MNKLIRYWVVMIVALPFCADSWTQAKKSMSLAEPAANAGADREQRLFVGAKAGVGTLLTRLNYFSSLLRAFEIAEVETPTCLATSASGNPYVP